MECSRRVQESIKVRGKMQESKERRGFEADVLGNPGGDVETQIPCNRVKYQASAGKAAGRC